MNKPYHLALCIVTILALALPAIGQQGFDDSEIYHYNYHYAFMPDVLIYKKGAQWKMKVEGIDKTVDMERLK